MNRIYLSTISLLALTASNAWGVDPIPPRDANVTSGSATRGGLEGEVPSTTPGIPIMTPTLESTNRGSTDNDNSEGGTGTISGSSPSDLPAGAPPNVGGTYKGPSSTPRTSSTPRNNGSSTR